MKSLSPRPVPVIQADDNPTFTPGTFDDPAVRAKYAQPGGKYYALFHRPIDTTDALLEHKADRFAGGSPPSIMPFGQ